MVMHMGRGRGDTSGAGMMSEVSRTAAAEAADLDPRVADVLTTIDEHRRYVPIRWQLHLADLFRQLHDSGEVEPVSSGSSPLAQVTQWTAQTIAAHTPGLADVKFDVSDISRQDVDSWGALRPGHELSLRVAVHRGGSFTGRRVVVSTRQDKPADIHTPAQYGPGSGSLTEWQRYIGDIARLMDALVQADG
jgi:hypothetical protein